EEPRRLPDRIAHSTGGFDDRQPSSPEAFGPGRWLPVRQRLERVCVHFPVRTPLEAAPQERACAIVEEDAVELGAASEEEGRGAAANGEACLRRAAAQEPGFGGVETKSGPVEQHEESAVHQAARIGVTAVTRSTRSFRTVSPY